MPAVANPQAPSAQRQPPRESKDLPTQAYPERRRSLGLTSKNWCSGSIPDGGFSNNVTFSCSPVTGISCTFNPPMVTPANGTASTTLTVTTSASVSRYGLLTLALIGPASLLSAFVLFAVVLRSGQNLRRARASLIAATAVLVIAGVSLTLGGCGGYGSTTKANRGTASVIVTAQSGAISHTATVVVTVQ